MAPFAYAVVNGKASGNVTKHVSACIVNISGLLTMSLTLVGNSRAKYHQKYPCSALDTQLQFTLQMGI